MIWKPGLGLCVFKIRQNVDRNNKFSLSLLHLSIYLCIKCKHINKNIFHTSVFYIHEQIIFFLYILLFIPNTSPRISKWIHCGVVSVERNTGLVKECHENDSWKSRVR